VLLDPLLGEERVEVFREFTGDDMADESPPLRSFDALPPSWTARSRPWEAGVDGAEREADERPEAGVETALPRPFLTGVAGLLAAGSVSLLHMLNTSSSESAQTIETR
jgi:hypothetical protein